MKRETLRNKAIYEERLKGTAFKELAEKYEVSYSRAEDIFYKEQAREKRFENTVFRELEYLCNDEKLFTRAITVLSRNNVTSEGKILALDEKAIRKMRGCGEKTKELILDMQEAIRHKIHER